MDYTKTIITDAEKLQEWCTEIDTKKENKVLQEIILSLKETMRKNNIVSLTAPQIGYDRRVVCMKFGANNYRTFVNPMIENNTGFQFIREGCSSLPNKTFIIPRFNNINLYFTTPLGKVESTRLTGLSAWRMQHCIDHLNGMLTSDIGLEIDEDFDNASEEDKAEIIKMYAESLDVRQKDLENEISNDKELSDISDAVKFVTSVKSGETILEKI